VAENADKTAQKKAAAKQLGAHVRTRREAIGWTQEQLAAAAGLSRKHVSSVERGQAPNVGARVIGAIADALDGVAAHVTPSVDIAHVLQFIDRLEADLHTLRTLVSKTIPASVVSDGVGRLSGEPDVRQTAIVNQVYKVAAASNVTGEDIPRPARPSAARTSTSRTSRTRKQER
jgi:transcriptional regulator with XRE-family HTH domain